MSTEYTLDTTVAFADVDRDQVLLLPRLLKLLQEAAIKHADLFDVGTRAFAERGTSWVLNRMAVAIERYPRYEEPVKIVTWSTGVHGFKGFREFRVVCGQDPIVAASSLWLWVDLRARMLTRVPADVAAAFPIGTGAPPFHPDIEMLRPAPPSAAAPAVEISLRHSDIDANGHVNNTAFFDFLQTALVRRGFPVRPRTVEIQFLKEIPASAERVTVQLEPRHGPVAFALNCAEVRCALGTVA